MRRTQILKKILKNIFLCIIFTSVMNLKVNASDSETKLHHWHFDIKVEENGDLKISEHWDISYKNTNTLYRNFQKTNDRKFKIENPVVYRLNNFKFDENSFELINIEKKPIKKSAEVREKQNIDFYHFGEYKGDLEFGIGVTKTSNWQRESYVYEYVLKGAVRKYKDTSELYYMAIADNNKLAANKFTMKISFPGAVNKEKSRIWLHTSSLRTNAYIHFKDGYVIAYTKGAFPENEMMELRILFPKEMTPNMEEENKNAFDEIVNEENNHKVMNENKKKANNILMKIGKASIIGSIVTYIIFIIVNSINKRKDKEERMLNIKEFKYYTEIPEYINLDLAKLQAVNPITNKINIFTSVILKLIMLKAVETKDDTSKKQINTFNKKEPIYPKIYILNEEKYTELEQNGKLDQIDKIVYEIIKKAGKGKLEITEKELNKELEWNYLKEFETPLNQIVKAKENRLKECGDLRKEKYPAKLNWAVGAIMLISIIILLILGILKFPAAPLYIFIPLISILELIILNVRSREDDLLNKGLQANVETKGLIKHLEDFSEIDKLNEAGLIKWEYYMIYANFYGITEKVLQNLKKYIPDMHNEIMNTSPSFYSFANYSSFVTTASISTGFGGAASYGGGGGGAGGGGGGGR